MSKRLRPRITFANVVSCLALFIALGSGAYAAGHLGKNSVGSKQLKKNAVTTAKIKKEAVTAAKVKNGTLTGNQINASTLGTVPTANTANTANLANTLAAPEKWHEVGVPGEPIFQNGCKNVGSSVQTVRYFRDHEGVVHLEGAYSCGVATDTAFQLPAGYRPGALLQFPMPGGGTALVEPSGDVFCVAASSCHLNGDTFRPES